MKRRAAKLFLAAAFVLAAFATLPFTASAETAYPALSEKTPSAGGKTYRIDPSITADGVDGVSKTFAGVNRLVLAPGDTVVVAPGTHTESLLVTGEGTVEKPITIRFLPGKHIFVRDGLLMKKLHISNTNSRPYEPKAVAIDAAGVKHLRIEGAGAEIIADGKMIFANIDKSEDVTAQGLTFDYLNPTMGEFTVVKSGEGFTDVKVCPGSPYVIEKGRMYWYGRGWKFPVARYFRNFDPKTGRYEYGLRHDGLTFEEISPGNVRLKYAKGNANLAPGMVVQNRDATRDCCAFFLTYSKDLVWKDITIRYMHGMGFICQYSENLTFDNLRTEPRPGSERTIVAWADVLQFSGCRGAILVKDSLLGYSHDDAINVHGTYLRIVDRPAPDRLVMRFMNAETYGIEVYFPGDEVDFVHADSLLPFGTRKVKAVRKIDDKNIELTLDSPAPEGIRDKDVLENATWTASLHVINTTVRADSTRGFLFKTRRPVLVEQCRFERTGSHAIWIRDEASGYFESGFDRDVTIRNNTFVECEEPVIAILPAVTKSEGPVHTGIRIENNRFEMTKGAAIYSRFSEVKQSGNTFLKDGVAVPEKRAVDIK